MYCRVLACDFDGTGASNGQLAPELAAALAEARTHGVATVLVTGRVHEDVESLCSDMSMFDAVIAENGAIVCLPKTGRTIQVGEPPPGELLEALRGRGVPFHTGAVVVGTWERHARDVFELVRQHGGDGQIVFNRGAVMILPSGVNKATGLRRALAELGRSEHNCVAFGDAENDVPLFNVAELAVAARGAVPAVKRYTQQSLAQPNGAGVARFIRGVLADRCRLRTPPRHQLRLGVDAIGNAVTIPANAQHVLVSGDPRSGKSWLAGLFAERLLDRDYRFCLIDPEGDHASLAQRPNTLCLGRDVALPEAEVLPRLLVDHGLSLVLVLARLSQRQQRAYVERALEALQACGDRTGLPHWVLVDEAHYFFNAHAGGAARFDGGVNFLLATYRPSLLPAAVHDAVGAHIIARTLVEEERYFVTTLLQARGPAGVIPHEALAELEPPRAGLLVQEPDGPRWSTFRPDPRATPHAHHARKYADVQVPDERAFWFAGGDARTPATVAHNVKEFRAAVQCVAPAILRRHLAAGDFSRWAGDVLADVQLAAAFAKIERTVQHGAAAKAADLVAYIDDRYDLPPDGGAVAIRARASRGSVRSRSSP